MKMMRKLTLPGLVFLLATLLGGQALAAQNVDEIKDEGVLHELVLDTNSVVINGVIYRVAYDARVQIRGSYGAFSMLQPGMKVSFEYRRFAADELEIFNIEQLPDNTALEES